MNAAYADATKLRQEESTNYAAKMQESEDVQRSLQVYRGFLLSAISRHPGGVVGL